MVNKHTRAADGLYHIRGQTYKVLTAKGAGGRAQVWHGTAYQTSGGLTKDDLLQNKRGRIVSRRKNKTAKAEQRLLKHGYGYEKGKFGYKRVSVGTGSRKRAKSLSRRKSSKRRTLGRRPHSI